MWQDADSRCFVVRRAEAARHFVPPLSLRGAKRRSKPHEITHHHGDCFTVSSQHEWHAACCHRMPRSDRDATSLTCRTAATRPGIARRRQAAIRTRGLWWRAGKAVGRCRSNSHCKGASAISDGGTQSGACDSDSTNSYAAASASASAGSSNSRTRCARADAATTAGSLAADNRTNDHRAAKQCDRCAARPAFDNAARIGQSRR
jgi:hypothetical protein